MKSLLIVLTLIALMVSPVLALAQDDDEMEMEMVEFETESGLVKITHPAEWFIADSGEEEDPTSLVFANNEDLLEQIVSDGDAPAEEGDKGGIIVGFPLDLLAFFGVEMTDETTAQDIVDAMSQLFFEESEDAEELPEIGESELLEWEDQPPIGIVSFKEPANNLEGVVYAYTKDGYAIFGFVAAAEGEFDEEYRDLGLQMVLTYEITIPADELLAQMMGQ